MQIPSRRTLILLTLSSAVLLPLALPSVVFPYGNSVLGFVCLAPVFVAVALAPTFGAASFLGVIFGLVSTGLANFWLMFFQGYSVWTFGGTLAGYIGYNALLFPFLRGFSAVRPKYRPFIMAAAWAFYEYLKSVGFLGYPWGLVANPAWDILPLIQFIDVTGVWGLSFLMALVNALVAEGVLAARGFSPGERPARRLGSQVIFAGVLVVLAVGYGAYRLSRPIPAEGSVRLLLVQQNIDPWSEGKARTDSTQINEELTREGLRAARAPVDVVVWSEVSVPNIWVMPGNQLRPPNNSLVPFLGEIGVPLLTGIVLAVDPRRYEFMNGAALLSPSGRILDTYGKMHPVPFAESIPFYEHDSVKWFFKNVIGVWNPWVMGTRQTVFRAPLRGGRELAFGAPICFEDAFGDLCRGFILRGADMWLNLTNDYWSKTVFSEVQHYQAARFRAVENRRVLVRSTNGGVTVVVGPFGEVIASLPLFTRETLEVDIPVYREPGLTFYTRHGDWFPKVLGALLVVLLLAEVIFTGRKRRPR
jgi:apolipoprotein N-acyltransferase